MIKQVVDGLHYKGAPFMRHIVERSEEARRLVSEYYELGWNEQEGIRSTSIEPMGNGYAVTINLEPQ